MNKVFLCSSTKETGGFLGFRWEIWSIGGGGGLQWYFFNKEIDPGRFNPIWLIYEVQRKR